MMNIYFSASSDDIYAEMENEKYNDYVINLANHGYYLAVDGLDIGAVTPKTSYLEIEGADGKIDITNALTDDIKYNNRNPKIKYIAKEMSVKDNIAHRNILENIFNGKIRKMYIDDCYLEGRFTINPVLSKPVGTYEINGDCSPYRMNVSLDTYIYQITSKLDCYIDYQDHMSVCPTITVEKADTDTLQFILGDSYYSLSAGENIIPDFIIKHGGNSFSFEGKGKATISFRGGNL